MRSRALKCVALGCLMAAATGAQTVTPVTPVTPDWINVKSFGAVGDGVTDDTPAVTQAIQAAINRGANGGAVVYFPQSQGYNLISPLVLPDAMYWTTLLLDAPVTLNHTLVMKDWYEIRGESGGPGKPAFTTQPIAYLGAPNDGEDAIHINANDVRLENLAIGYVRNPGNGIVIQSSAQIDLVNVIVGLDSGNHTGHGLVIQGGFGYRVLGGGYDGYGASSILIGSDPRCDSTGIMTFKDLVLAGNGIAIEPQCAPLNQLTFENILYEDATDALLTIQPEGNGSVSGIRLLDSSIADPVGVAPPLIHSTGNQAWSILVQNCFADSQLVNSGDPILDLEVWTAFEGTQVGQKTGYVLHRPSGVLSTVTAQQPPINPAPPLHPYRPTLKRPKE